MYKHFFGPLKSPRACRGTPQIQHRKGFLKKPGYNYINLQSQQSRLQNVAKHVHIAKTAWCLNRWGVTNDDLSLNMTMVAPIGHAITKLFKHNPGRRHATHPWFGLCPQSYHTCMRSATPRQHKGAPCHVKGHHCYVPLLLLLMLLPHWLRTTAAAAYCHCCSRHCYRLPLLLITLFAWSHLKSSSLQVASYQAFKHPRRGWLRQSGPGDVPMHP